MNLKDYPAEVGVLDHLNWLYNHVSKGSNILYIKQLFNASKIKTYSNFLYENDAIVSCLQINSIIVK